MLLILPGLIINMLRMRKRRSAVSEDSTQDNAHVERSHCDANTEAVTKIIICRSAVREETSSNTDKPSVIVKARKHSETEIPSRKKNRRFRNSTVTNVNNSNEHDDNKDDFSDIVLMEKISSTNDPTVTQTENVCQMKKKKKLRGADVEDSARKKRKRKVDSDDSELKASVLRHNSKSDSVSETNDADSSEKSSLCDLQHLEDSIVDDYVSTNVVDLYDVTTLTFDIMLSTVQYLV